MRHNSGIIKFKKFFSIIYILTLCGMIFPVFDILGIVRLVAFIAVYIIAEYRYKIIYNRTEKKVLSSVVTSIVFSFILLLLRHVYPYWDIVINTENIIEKSALFILFLSALTILFYPLFNGFLCSLYREEFSKRKFGTAFLFIGLLFFLIMVYLPSDSFINNIDDYGFTYQIFIAVKFIYFLILSLICSFIAAFLKRNVYNVISAFFTGVDLCIYIQYMFLNRNLIELGGETMNWNKYLAFSIWTGVLWLAVIAGFIIFALVLKKIYQKVYWKIAAILGGVHLLTLALALIAAGNAVFEPRCYFLSGQEQYTVSDSENLIVFVLDATDNIYFEELLKKQPEVFDDFNDFTLYTDTCSVFDSTPTSLAQMFGGMEFKPELTKDEWYDEAWNGKRAVEFFERFHDNGYVVNGFNINSDKSDRFDGKFDNCRNSRESEEKVEFDIDYHCLSKDITRLSMYRALPFLLKRFVDIESVDFNKDVMYKDRTDYMNEDFNNNLNLKISSSDSKYFIIEHLWGTHPPVEIGFIDDTVIVLKIVNKYMNQLKNLGVYDDSTIIITSDHGRHNNVETGKAATPIFMIKQKNVSKDTMNFCKAPIYHEDIQSTLLDCAGLYDKDYDEEFFGRSIFDIKENEKRTRTWYDRRDDMNYELFKGLDTMPTWKGCNAYYGYTYTGNSDVLRKMVAEGKVTEIYPMKDIKG